jgi:signal transduction histidine kinase
MTQTENSTTVNVTVAALDDLPFPLLHCDDSNLITWINRAAQEEYPQLRLRKNAAHLIEMRSWLGVTFNFDELRTRLASSPDKRSQLPIDVVVRRSSGKNVHTLGYASAHATGLQFVLLPALSELDRVVNRIFQAYLRHHKREELFTAITSEVYRLSGADRVFLKLLDPASGLLLHKAHIPSANASPFPVPCSAQDSGIPGWVFSNRRAYYSTNIHNEPLGLSQTRYPDTCSRLACPILFRDSAESASPDVYGVIVVDSTKPDAFDDSVFQSCATISRYAGIVLAEINQTDRVRTRIDQVMADLRRGHDAQLTTSILHDGRSMINTVVDALEAMEREMSETPFGRRRARELGDRLDRLRHLSGLMDVLLQKMKDSGDEPTHKAGRWIDLREVAQRVIGVLSLAESDIVEVNLKTRDQSYPLNTREYFIVAIFYNLIANAIAAIKHSGRKASVEVSIADAPNMPDRYRITISDNGPGLRSERLQHVRHKVSFSDSPRGVGLGLKAVQNIIKNELRGTIDIDSTFGKRTRIIIEIPKELESKEAPLERRRKA